MSPEMTNHHFLAFLLVRLDDVKATKVEGFAQWAREAHRWGARGERGGVRVCGGRVLAGLGEGERGVTANAHNVLSEAMKTFWD